jgi:ferredoxin--NADP+ reductase
MRLVYNELYQTDVGTLRPKPIERFDELDVGLVFRSIGYRGVPLPDIPFNDSWGVILNEAGRIVAQEDGKPVVGLYTAGWIKRGPSGVIGTNKLDAAETIDKMLEDLASEKVNIPSKVDPAMTLDLIKKRQPNYFSFEDWLRLDALEISNGQKAGRPRVKFTSIEEMVEAIK